jgi:hypothetical protein
VTERKVFEWLAARNTTREVAGDADGGAPTAAEGSQKRQNAEGAEGGTENAGGTSAPAAE